MKISYRLLMTLAASVLIAPIESPAQEGDSTSEFQQKVDSIVQSMFQRFDEVYGTSIFTEEPSTRSTAESLPGVEKSTRWRSVHRRHTPSPSGLYASCCEHGVVRNMTAPLSWEELPDHILFRYNRVEGLFLGLSHPQRFNWEDRRISIFGSGGYGFAFHRWRYELGIAQNYGIDGHTVLGVGIDGHGLTDSKDRWLTPTSENTLSSIVLRDDYFDYFTREGVSAWIGLYNQWQSMDMQTEIAYLNDRYESLERYTNWSIFGGDKIFRANPSITDGRMRSILTTFKIHSTDEHRYLLSGWSASASGEFAGKSLGGDFDFNQYIIDIRRYQPISRVDNVNLRLRIGSITGNLYPQKAFDLGGWSTVPAFMFKEFSGNRMLLMNAEYVLSGHALDDIDFLGLMHDLSLILFTDAGFVSTVSGDAGIADGFGELNQQSLKSDWGFGIGTRDARVRLGFAWRTDVADPVRVFFRISRPF